LGWLIWPPSNWWKISRRSFLITCRRIDDALIRLLLGLLLGLLGSSPGVVARTDGALVEVRVGSDPPGE